MNKNSKAKQTIWGLLLILVLIGIDQASKLLAIRFLKDKDPIVLIKGVFELSYLENRGAAFGIMEGQKIFFIIMTLVILGVIFYCYLLLPQEKKYLPLRILCYVMTAGAIGNFIDRMMRGFVVDFFSFVLIHFPVFNVADIYVTLSCACLLILLFFVYKDEDFAFLSVKRKEH